MIRLLLAVFGCLQVERNETKLEFFWTTFSILDEQTFLDEIKVLSILF
jgi:hypothetical protein